MFIGHFALGFAAKRVLPKASLAVLFAAAQLADLLWPVLVAVGLEYVLIDPGNTAVTPLDFVSYPYSHSLVTLMLWGLMAGWIYRTRAGDRRSFAVLAGLVVSHWVLDVITHRPDMPIYPRGPTVGLGLWNSVPATLAVEVPMYVIGVWIYADATRARDRIGRWGFASLAITLAVISAANLLGPPPPSVQAIWIAGISGGALFTAWSWWVDRHRVASTA